MAGESNRADVRNFLAQSVPNQENLLKTKPDSSDALYEGQVYPFVVALVPAHNEALRIAATIESLQNQTRPPDQIIVIADNCTDQTAAIVLAMGATVIESVDNKDMKAGALNAVLETLLPLLEETDSILVMDADTVLSPNFIRAALRVLFEPLDEHTRPVGGVGGIFLASQEKWSLARQLQINEYIRYQRRLGRRHGRALVLTGTGTLFNVRTLRAVAEGRRSGRFPSQGGRASVYDTGALTEDNELTLCAKQLGYRVLSPKECTVETAIMPDFRSLFKQRRRWQRGALENLYNHKLDRFTAPYLLRQILTYIGVIFVMLYITTLTVALVRNQSVEWDRPIWLIVAFTYLVEQVISVRRGGFRAILTTLLILPEVFYNMFLNYVYLISLEGLLYGLPETWGRVRDVVKSSEPSDAKSKRQAGSVDKRLSFLGRVESVSLETAKDSLAIFILSLAFWASWLAWDLLAIYVLIGFGATLLRLVPRKMT